MDGLTDLRFSRARPHRARLRDATRRAKTRRGSAGPADGRASAATASWAALPVTLVRCAPISQHELGVKYRYSDSCYS